MVDGALVVLRDHAVIDYLLDIVLQAEHFSQKYNITIQKSTSRTKNVEIFNKCYLKDDYTQNYL